MSEENVEAVRQGIEHLNQTGEFDFRRIDPNVVLDNSNAMLDAAIYRGYDGLREFSSLMRGMWKRMRFEPQEFIPVGDDRVIVPIRMVMVGRDEIETVAHTALLYTLLEGKLTHAKAFQSRAEALEAAGLSE